MKTDREKYLEMMKYSQEMLDNSVNEANIMKKVNPKKEIADVSHFNEIQNQINQQFINEGVEPIHNKKNIIPKKEDNIGTNKSSDKYTKEKPYYNLNETDEKQNELSDEGMPKRQIPEAEQKIIEELRKQNELRPNRNYEPFKPPVTKRKYDAIKLPSKGECYPHKKGRIPVFYLTAREEDLITSFNLYKGGLLVDAILKSTIADPEIDPDTLIQADIDAIILFLRATAYGPEFPIIAKNPKNDEEFEVTISLTQIKYKDFDLKGDEYGWFDYTTSDGDIIKWTIPNRSDNRTFEKMVSDIEKNVQTFKLSEIVDNLRLLGKIGFEEITQNDLLFFDNTCNKLEIIKNKLSKGNNTQFYSDILTTQMAMITMSVNGIMDREYVKEYIYNMRAGEARKYRQHVDKNVPSLDYTIEIIIPEGQEGAGETFKTQLSIDDTIFLNVAN
jgi:hypothetical protein